MRLKFSALLVAVVSLSACDAVTSFHIHNPCSKPVSATAYVEVHLREPDQLAQLKMYRVPPGGEVSDVDDVSLHGDSAELVVEDRDGAREIIGVPYGESGRVDIPESFCSRL